MKRQIKLTEEELKNLIQNKIQEAVNNLDYMPAIGNKKRGPGEDIEDQMTKRKNTKLDESNDEEAVSKSQQRLFGMVHACQKNGECPSKKVKDLAKSMSKKDVDDFAETKHKGLPNHVKEGIDNIVAGVIKEYAYHERQNKNASPKDNKEIEKKYNEWIAKKSKSKQGWAKKEKDGDSVDYYDYKHGKNNYKPVKESKMNETTLDYDMDNFSGRWNRGQRYDIEADGFTVYHDVPEESVDRLCDELERRGYEDIKVYDI